MASVCAGSLALMDAGENHVMVIYSRHTNRSTQCRLYLILGLKVRDIGSCLPDFKDETLIT